MPRAARIGDPIAHTHALGGFLAGALIGVAAAVAAAGVIGAVATAAAVEVASGGLATPLVAGAAVTAGEFVTNMVVGGALMSLGEALGEKLGRSMMGPPTGTIISGSPNVMINGRPAARVLDPVACAAHGAPDTIAQGSTGVFINGMPAARVGDRIVCGGVIIGGSGNVMIGGVTITKAPIQSEIPVWARRAALLASLAPGGFGLGRALMPALRSISENGLLATAKAGVRALRTAMEERAGGAPKPAETAPEPSEPWEKPYAEQQGVKFRDFRTKGTYDPSKASLAERKADRTLRAQGWNEDMTSQVMDSGREHQIVPYRQGAKVYGFSSKGYTRNGATVIKGSDPQRPSAYWFHEDDLHAATVNRDLDNVVAATIDHAYENYDLTLPDGTIRAGSITLPGGQRQITLPADSLGQFEILR